MKIEIPDLTAQECGDIAITAAEGGIGYWSQIDAYRPSRWCDGPRQDDGTADDDFVYYSIAVLREDKGIYDWSKPIPVTPALIRRGMERGFAADVNKGGWAFRRLLDVAREDWTGEIDADCADLIIQFGVFGEVVYG